MANKKIQMNRQRHLWIAKLNEQNWATRVKFSFGALTLCLTKRGAVGQYQDMCRGRYRARVGVAVE